MGNIHKIVVLNIIERTYALFHRIGLWTNKDSLTIGQYFRFIYFSLVMVCISVEVISADTTDEMIFLVVTTFIGTVQLFKMYCLIWKQREITEFTWKIGVHNTDDVEAFSGASKKLKNYTILLTIFEAYMVVAGAAVVIIPIATGRIIFNIAFPLDYENNETAFWITYGFISLGFLLSIVCCMFAPIVWYLMLNLIINYDILGSQFRNVFNDTTEITQKVATKVQNGLFLKVQNTKVQNGLFLKKFIRVIKIYENTNEYVNVCVH